MALSLLSIHDPTHYKMQSGSSMSPSESHAVRMDLSRRKQKNPKPISNSGDMEDELDKSFEVNGDSNPGDQRDISELVKVEINNSADDIDTSDTNNRNLRSPRTSHQLFPPMDDIMRKCNLVPFGDVTIPNHPNTPPIPMTIPMAYLFPISKDEVTGEAKYKMLISRNGPEIPMGFPPNFHLPSPPLIPHMNQRLPNNFIAEDIAMTESKKQKLVENKDSNDKNINLKIECNDPEGSSTPLDLTHRSPNSSFSDIEEDVAKTQLPKKESFHAKQSPSASPEQKLGSEIEEQLHFLKVKQMEFLKQAAESVVNRCNECNINFSKYQNYLAHKKYYCSGLKQQQPQDSDEESSQHSVASKKPTLPSPASPPFSPTSQQIPIPKQNIFNQDFFLSQKSLLENFPSKMPLLMAPGAMGLQQPNTSHFVCQGCGIKFKSISNLKAHQSRYCSGIKNPEEGNNLEALLKNQMSQMPIQGMSAADMISFLSAHQAVKSDDQKKNAVPQPSRGKSPKGFSDSTKSEPTDDFCCILCGFKESSVDKLKDHINMHFIGQVKKRKADNETDSHTSDDSNHSAPTEAYEDHHAKKVKKEDDMVDKRDIHEGARRHNIGSGVETENADVKQEAESNTMTCRNCEITFVNTTTYTAHVKYYCKKKKDDEQE
eukprot:GFUD01016515.1.p1 GENE.GFUD01016515.1~~GFUD01016515.1.p1  ORF type:complete len:657 (+),score=162.09 GFUD01016515.1:95-2065(+)